MKVKLLSSTARKVEQIELTFEELFPKLLEVGGGRNRSLPQELFRIQVVGDGPPKEWDVDCFGIVQNKKKFHGMDILVPLLWSELALQQGADAEVDMRGTPHFCFNFEGEGEWKGIPHSLIRRRMRWKWFCLWERPDGSVLYFYAPSTTSSFAQWVEAMRQEKEAQYPSWAERNS